MLKMCLNLLTNAENEIFKENKIIKFKFYLINIFKFQKKYSLYIITENLIYKIQYYYI